MKQNILLYGNLYLTSFIFIHALRRLLSDYPAETQNFHFHLILDDRRDRDLAASLLPRDRVTLYAQYEECHPWDRNRAWPVAIVQAWERRYGSPHLKVYTASERILAGRSEEERQRYLLSQIEYFEGHIRRLNPSLFICGQAGSLPPWVAIKVFQENSIPTLIVSCSRFENRCFTPADPHERLQVETLYHEKQQSGLSEEEHQTVETIFHQYRTKRAKPVEFRPIRKAIQPKWIPRPNRFLHTLWEYACTDRRYYDEPLSAILLRALKSRRSWVYDRILKPCMLRQIPSEPRFFFFPLQVEPEMSLSTQGRGWMNQLELIRLISECLPIDRWLYVKEHPMMASGLRPFGFYREMLRLPRVKLLHQGLDSYAVVPHAEAVITIGSTAGWEALMFGKPVLLIGHAFYEEFREGVICLNELESLPRLLRQMRSHRFSNDAFRAFTAAVLTKAPRGFLAEPRFFPALMNPVMDNVEGFVDLFLSRISELHVPLPEVVKNSGR